MSSKDHESTPPPTSKSALLDELESIKDLLDDSFDTDIDDDNLSIDIPVLDDVVTSPENDDANETALLNLEQIFDEDDGSDSLDPKLTKMEELDLDGLDLEDLSTHIDIPSFKLRAEISDHSVTNDDVPPPSIEPLSARPATTVTDINAKGDSLFFEDELNIIDGDMWLSDTATANNTTASDAPDDLLTDDLLADKEANNETTAAQTATSFSEEEQEDMFPDLEQLPDTSSNAQEHRANIEGDLDLNFLIQEIVDEVIPRIEDQLRQRLSQYSHTAIKQLANKYLDN